MNGVVVAVVVGLNGNAIVGIVYCGNVGNPVDLIIVIVSLHM